jgi:protoporphyrinogen/coproporphyrinogen III oxidase
MKKIVIIGGGIAGLAAAHRLQEEISNGSKLQCIVLEASEQFGGKIATERFDGFVIERGPDSFISQKPAAIELCKKLGLGDRLVGTNQEQTKTYVYTGKKLVTMPDGLSLMIPTKFLPFALTPLFSLPGKARMALDLIIPKKRGNGDESLASFVRRRMGEEALRKMAEPMLAGIYASDPETMSIHSTFPMFVQTEKKYRSLILGMLARKRQMLMQKPSQPKPGNNHQPFSLFMTLKNGLGEMVDAVIEKSPDVSFRTNARVSEVTAKKDATAWQVVLEDGETIDADGVIFATPAKLSASFLQPIAPKVAQLLNQIKYVSTATATLAYRREEFSHPLNGFGFVVPRTEGRKILACTWTSSKFPHRTPEGYVMLRCFVGGAMNEDLAEQDEEAIATMVKKELADLMGIHQEPEICKVFHNKKSNVQYRVGHAGLIDSVQKELQAFSGLFLTGSAYTGIGIPDCIQNGTRTAESAIQYFSKESQT